MKKIKKAVTLTMAAIMFFYATPALQASTFATLDREQLNIIQDDIETILTDTIKDEDPYKNLPSIKEIKKRYDRALEIYESNLQTLSGSQEEENIEDYKAYIEELKREAKRRIYEDSRYEGFSSEKEKEQVAFYSVLLEEIDNHNIANERDFKQIVVDNGTPLKIIGIVFNISSIVLLRKASSVILRRIGVGLMVGGVAFCMIPMIFETFTQPSVLHFNPNLSENEILRMFLESPFEHLAKMKENSVDDFTYVYGKSPRLAQVLSDAVDIEYYTALNPTLENMKAKLYIQTINYRTSTTETQALHLHKLAQQLKAEAEELRAYQTTIYD